MSERERRFAALGFELERAPTPAANYLPLVTHAGIAYLSGALPTDGERGLLYRGQVGDTISLEQGQRAAELCAVNLLRVLRAELGSLESIGSVLRLGVYVSSAPHFTDAHLVANGASDLLTKVLGDPGKHARSALSVPILPLGAAVEVDAIIALSQP